MKLAPISQVCPNCIEPLILNKKKMAGMTNWFVCPKCGYRERPSVGVFKAAETDRFCDRLKRSNAANIKIK